MNILREQLKEGRLLFGTVVSLSDPAICEIVGNAGYDCVWIDTEHTYLSPKEVLCHLNAARAVGLSALVRVPQNDLTATKRILEMGPDGILFPMVRSYQEFQELLSMTLYPPLGTRGFGPMRAVGYRPERSDAYVNGGGQLSLCRFFQIEAVSMIDELDRIAASPYVDGFLLGPNDLSGSVGEMLNVLGERTAAAMRRACEIARRNGKRIGVACGGDAATLSFFRDLGVDMIFAGGDWQMLAGAAADTAARLNALR